MIGTVTDMRQVIAFAREKARQLLTAREGGHPTTSHCGVLATKTYSL